MLSDQEASVEAWIEKAVADAPPLTSHQITVVRTLMGLDKRDDMPERPEEVARRNALEALAKVRKEFSEALHGCHGCGLTQAAHRAQRNRGLSYHDFEDLAPADVAKLAIRYGRKITKAEQAVTDLGKL